jgi:hypothetical protein
MDRAERLADLSSRFIAMAISLTGSAGEVRAAMRCSEEQFLQYCDGAKAPTWQELCWLITLVVEEQRKVIARNRDLLAARRAKRFRPNGVPMDEPVRYALGRAFAITGGMRALAGQLEVPVPDLVRWLDGADKPPREVLATVGEMLAEEVSGQRTRETDD